MALTHVADALADCLDAASKGEAELAACIDRYPQHKGELAALLRMAASLPRVPKTALPSPAWHRQTKTALLAKIQGRQPRGSAHGV